ncbi:McrC family protein [Teredinibacter turnerae]|uniref:McrC family protein n=1 Tax=Teredinibacter turnerae TaxID=2426 RepID=UPI0030D0DC79
MSEVLVVLEHQKIPIVNNRSVGEFALSSKHAGVLEGIKTLPGNAYAWGRDSITWKNYCGLVCLGDVTLEILPKISDTETHSESARISLVRMLRIAGLLKLHRPGSAGIEVKNCSLLDVFISDFCELVSREIARGPAKRYVIVEENLRVVRGKLKVTQQLKSNLAHKERLYCEYDELSEDNIINQSIRYALHIVSKKATQPLVKKQVLEQLNRFDHVSPVQLSPDQVETIDLNRNERRFSDILKYCELFIRTLAPTNSAGKQDVFSLLFDMNQLFEAWLCAMIRPLAHEMGLTLKTQGPRKYLAYREDIESKVFQMKPDISLLNQAGQVVLIADAKWKVLEDDEKKLGVSQADMYQLSAYGARYMSNALALIYPRVNSPKNFYQFRLNIGDGGRRLTVATCGLQNLSDEILLDNISSLLISHHEV